MDVRVYAIVRALHCTGHSSEWGTTLNIHIATFTRKKTSQQIYKKLIKLAFRILWHLSVIMHT